MLFVSGYSIGLTEDNVFTGRVDALLLNRENVKKNTFMSNDTIRSLSDGAGKTMRINHVNENIGYNMICMFQPSRHVTNLDLRILKIMKKLII